MINLNVVGQLKILQCIELTILEIEAEILM
jgi:hypothetical protein